MLQLQIQIHVVRSCIFGVYLHLVEGLPGSTIPIKLGRTRAISPSHCAKQVETHPKRLGAVIVAKGASTKYWPKRGWKFLQPVNFDLYMMFFQVFLTCNLLQLQQCVVWSHWLWIKKFLWKNCFSIICNSLKCGIFRRGWILLQATVSTMS